jgi:hypothetical protein
VDSLFAAVFSSVSLSYNSFSLASTLAVSLVLVPLNLYMLVFAFSVSFAFYAILPLSLARRFAPRSPYSPLCESASEQLSFVLPLRHISIAWGPSSLAFARSSRSAHFVRLASLRLSQLPLYLRACATCYSRFFFPSPRAASRASARRAVRCSYFILTSVNPARLRSFHSLRLARSLFSVLYLLSLTYSSYLIFLLEFISFSSAPAYSTRFAFLYAFIPLAILALLLL